jgi:hypothetical protein
MQEKAGFGLGGLVGASISIVLGILTADEGKRFTDDQNLLKSMERNK